MSFERPILVICGNGAGAVALLYALSKRPVMPLRVLVIGNGEPGEGIAYATRNPGHLLNTQAARMSIDPCQADHFTDWLEGRNVCTGGWMEQFVPRFYYAQYLRDMAQAAARHPDLDVAFIRAEIVSLTRKAAGWRVAYHGGFVDSDFVVLATGNDLPTPVSPRMDAHIQPLVIDNPWELPLLNPDETVLVLGTGLSAVDAVLSLIDRDHRAPVFLVSRRGILPAAHVPPDTEAPLAPPYPETALGALKALRAAAGPRPTPQRWQGLMDAMRPCWPLLWQALRPEEKQRFLRHCATIWNMHRHRLPPQVARRMHIALGRNTRIIKGHLISVAPTGDAEALVTLRHGDAEQSLTVHRIINCMGPNCDPDKTHNRLIDNIVASRQARTADCGIGLDVTDDNRVIDREGRPQMTLFAMGALTRGRWWESAAISEIAGQAAQIAASLDGAWHWQNLVADALDAYG